MYRYVILLTLCACAATPAPPPESPPRHIVIEEEPPFQPGPVSHEAVETRSAACDKRQAKIDAMEAELDGMEGKRKEWFAAHCKRQIPEEVNIRIQDGKRFRRVSPEGVYWVCDNGQITNSEYSPEELDMINRIQVERGLMSQACPR